MTDRQMLEDAARAAGIVGAYEERWNGFLIPVTIQQPDDGIVMWNPRDDSGDALCLATKLRLDIEHGSPLDNSRYVLVSRCGIEMVRDAISVIEEFEDESGRDDATRRAITRAAASIGAAMRARAQGRDET